MNDKPFVPDFTGVNIGIATPTHDGKYERAYLKSFYNTGYLLEKYGAKWNFIEFPYCADIALARAKILGAFLHSENKYTHMMMIDADMGWNPEDVLRLLLLKRDFVGAAGPKKQYPIKFAANLTDDFGKKLPLMQEVDTGLVEVSEVGMAFMLITRELAQKVVDAYPGLQFDGDGERTEYAVFDPMVVNRIRLSEDYAFCRRVRAVGGKVMLLPTIKMSHTGSHTFYGALEEGIKEEKESANKAK